MIEVRMLEHRLLAYFLTVCEELHFTKAAEKLGISQPTLSQQIRLLESRLGTPLFQRIGKKVFVTEAGQILHKHSRNIFHELDQAQTAINEMRGMQRGSLRIGSSGNHLLTATILSFYSSYPKIELSVTELATEETKERLLSNQLDLGVVFLPDEEEHLQRIPLYNERLQLVVSSRHPLAASESIRLRDLDKLPLAMLQKKFYVRQMIDVCADRIGFPLKPALELSTLESLLQMARNNLCGAILPESYIKSVSASAGSYRSIPIVDPVPQKEVGIVFRKDMFMCTTTDTFIKELMQHFK
jgi:LysR family transcriptional regulator, cyn operon transcriptional activator